MTQTPNETKTVPPPSSRKEVRGSNTEEVQFHYDLSNDFFRLWQDPTQTYSCAYFERDDMTLEEAQIAKIDLSLGKLGLQPGMTLLDIGCGWGSTMMRAVEKYDVNVDRPDALPQPEAAHRTTVRRTRTARAASEVRLQPWEQFDEPVDRIVSIGAFEHFGFEKYDVYFKKTYDLMPDDGVMLLHTIVVPSAEEVQERQLPLTMSLVRFIKFILDRNLTPAVGCRWSRRSRSTPPRPAST